MPIISPWIFYLVELLCNLKDFFVTTMFVVVVLFIASLAVKIFTINELEYYSEDEEEYKDLSKLGNVCVKIMKFGIIGFITASLLNVFIPSKDTMYTMLVANYVTYENVDIATDVIQDGVDYIFDKFNGNDTEE